MVQPPAQGAPRHRCHKALAAATQVSCSEVSQGLAFYPQRVETLFSSLLPWQGFRTACLGAAQQAQVDGETHLLGSSSDLSGGSAPLNPRPFI